MDTLKTTAMYAIRSEEGDKVFYINAKEAQDMYLAHIKHYISGLGASMQKTDGSERERLEFMFNPEEIEDAGYIVIHKLLIKTQQMYGLLEDGADFPHDCDDDDSDKASFAILRWFMKHELTKGFKKFVEQSGYKHVDGDKTFCDFWRH